MCKSNCTEMQKYDLSTNALKMIAIAAMLCDHIARNFIAGESTLSLLMHFIGRFTAPMMFYFAVEGYHHTRNIKRYLLRLFVFAVISQLPFAYFKGYGTLIDNGYLLQLNVIFNIFFGVLSIYIVRANCPAALKALLIAAIFVLNINSDWGYISIMIMLVFDFFYGSYKNQAMGYLLVVLAATSLLYLLMHPFEALAWNGRFEFDMDVFKGSISDAGMLIPIILLSFYHGNKGSGSKTYKWLFYIFYPAHLLILGFMSGMTR